MDFANFLIQLLNSLQYGLLLFMLAAGLTLIFGIMGVVNLAHGSFYMLGAYLAWFLVGQLDSLVLAIVLGTVMAVALGWFLEWSLFRHFYHRDHLDQVLLTFGLIGPGKGIEQAIRAMPEIVARHPEVAYVVLGATHPNLIAREGEKYREGLEQRAKELGVTDHVIFHNCYATPDDLREFIGATDIYLTPYPNEAQITSGALARVFGAGRAVVSTPLLACAGAAGGRPWHARSFPRSRRDRHRGERLARRPRAP